jgi:hypothetical protein
VAHILTVKHRTGNASRIIESLIDNETLTPKPKAQTKVTGVSKATMPKQLCQYYRVTAFIRYIAYLFCLTKQQKA